MECSLAIINRGKGMNGGSGVFFLKNIIHHFLSARCVSYGGSSDGERGSGALCASFERLEQ